jgi:hypothetical protein
MKIYKGELLAIAEGEGRNAVYLASLRSNVTTWDYLKVDVEKTKALVKNKGVTVYANQRIYVR